MNSVNNSLFKRLSPLLILAAVSLAGCSGGGSSSPSMDTPATGNTNPTPAVNTAPDAVDDEVTFQRGTGENIQIAVLFNDTDADGNPINLTDFQPTTDQGGMVTRDDRGTPNDFSDDRLIYEPAGDGMFTADFNGTDTFTYNVDDGNDGTDMATVTVVVIEQGCVKKQELLNAGEGYCFNAFFNTAHDGTRIDMTVYVPHPDTLPNGPSGEGYAPFLLHGHGFGGSKNADFSANTGHFVDNQAALAAWTGDVSDSTDGKGWFVISFSERGFGQSGGQIGFMDPTKEGQDINEILDWAVKHLRGKSGPNATDSIYDFEFDETNAQHISSVAVTDNRPSLLMNDNQTRLLPTGTGVDANPAAGTLGYSYGGGFQYTSSHADSTVADVTARTEQDRWNAHVPEGTWHDLRYALHANDVPKTYWATLLFSFAVEGGTLSNGQPTPQFLQEVYAEAVVGGRVSADKQNILGGNSTSEYCDFVNGVTSKADVFHIQGVRDTLFNFNEGYDNVKCFDNANRDARFLAVSGGHPYTAYQTVNTSRVPYTNQTTSMDIDEIVHCALPFDADGDGDTGGQERLRVTDMILGWYDEKLAGIAGAADIVPKVCIAQHNTDETDFLDDEGFTQQSGAQFYYLKEGVVYNDIDDVLIGAGATPNYTCDDAPVVGSAERCPINATVQVGGTAQASAAPVDIPLVTIPAGTTQVMAGIPTVKLDIANVTSTGSLNILPISDYKIFVSVTLTRNGNLRILHDQVTPIRGTEQYPYVAIEHFSDTQVPNDTGGTGDLDFVATENGNPIVYGCGMDAEQLSDCPEGDRGRLIGITTRLLPGDVVGLRISSGDFLYAGIANTPSQLTVTGDVELPILAPTPLPESNN